MRSTRRATLHVEAVEPRHLLSTLAPPAPAPTAAHVSPLIVPAPLLLTGQVRGTALVRSGIPDAGDQYTLRGAGRVGPVGPVNLRGLVQSTSITGGPTGAVTLSNRFGSAELRVIGAPTPSDATPAKVFDFEVTRATGRFARLLGTGGVLELATGRPGRAGYATFRLGINPVVIAAV